MKQLILISGIPSAGKTTLAYKIRDVLGVKEEFCIDYVYYNIGKELKIKDLADPNNWKGVDKSLFLSLKEKHYKKMLPKDNKVLIEGFGLCIGEDREIIKNIYKDYNITYIYKDITYNDWLKQKGVVDCQTRKEEYNSLMRMVTLEPDTIIIK